MQENLLRKKMNIIDYQTRDNKENQDVQRLAEVKIEEDTKSNSVKASKSMITSLPSVPSTSSDSPSRIPYPNDLVPPVYMSTIAQSTSYLPAGLNHSTKYSSNDYSRQYQSSPPSIDKAPSFVSRSMGRNSDPETQSNGTAPPSPSTTPPEDKHVWSKGEVELLLDMYETYKEQLKDPRVRKTKVWEDIARVIRERLDSDVNGCQCNQKFRNLKADFQKVIEHNGRPGNFKRVCKYYDRLANILNYPVSSSTFHATHSTYSTVDHRENGGSPTSIHSHHRDYFYENGNSPVHKLSNKRKLPDNLPLMNGLHNGHIEPYYASKKLKPNCNCECSLEIVSLRETIERVNNYVVARSSHEEERMRRLEEIHREKMIAMSRFVDIFKDFIHKMG